MTPYPTYKDSGIEWIGEIPEHWEITRVKFESTHVIDGTHFTPTYTDNGIPFLRVTDLNNKRIDLEKVKYISEEEHNSLIKRCNPQKGDLLLSKNGTIGLTKVITWDWVFSIFVSLCLIKFKDSYSPFFFSYLFKSNFVDLQLSQNSKQSTVTNLHLDKIRELKILLPPIPEQKAIATYLDHKTALIDELIAKAEQKIALLKEQRSALINQAVTKGLDPEVEMKDSGVEWIGEVPKHWKNLSLKRVVSTKITDGPHTTPDFLDEGVPFVSAEGVENGTINFQKIRGYISEEADKEYSKKCKPQYGDIFIVKSGSTTGKVGYVETYQNFNIWSPIALVRINENYGISRFIFYSLSSEYFQKQIQLSWSFGTQPNIGMGIIENLRVILPPSDEQKSIVQILEKRLVSIDKTLRKDKDRINLLLEYRQSLISEVVTGKISVLDQVPPN